MFPILPLSVRELRKNGPTDEEKPNPTLLYIHLTAGTSLRKIAARFLHLLPGGPSYLYIVEIGPRASFKPFSGIKSDESKTSANNQNGASKKSRPCGGFYSNLRRRCRVGERKGGGKIQVGKTKSCVWGCMLGGTAGFKRYIPTTILKKYKRRLRTNQTALFRDYTLIKATLNNQQIVRKLRLNYHGFAWKISDLDLPILFGRSTDLDFGI